MVFREGRQHPPAPSERPSLYPSQEGSSLWNSQPTAPPKERPHLDQAARLHGRVVFPQERAGLEHRDGRAPSVSAEGADVAMAVAVDQVVVHHPDRLHMRVDDRRPDETEATVS